MNQESEGVAETPIVSKGLNEFNVTLSFKDI